MGMRLTAPQLSPSKLRPKQQLNQRALTEVRGAKDPSFCDSGFVNPSAYSSSSSLCLRAIPTAANKPLKVMLINDYEKDGTVFTSFTAVIVIGTRLLFSLDSATESSVSTAR